MIFFLSIALFFQNAFPQAPAKDSHLREMEEEPAINKARRLIQEKKYLEAKELLDQAIAASQDQAEFYYLRAAAKHYSDDHEGAEADALAAIEKSPAPKYEDYALLAHIKYNVQDFSAAKQAAEDAVSMAAPQSLPEILRVHGLSALKLYEKDSRVQDLESALESFEKALALKPESQQTPEFLELMEKLNAEKSIMDTYSHIESLVEEGKTLDALKLADQLISSDPHLAAVYGLRGIINIYLGREAAALKDFDRFVFLEPNSREAHLSYAGGRFLISEFAAAAEAAGRAIELSSSAEEAAEARSLRIESLISLAVEKRDGMTLSRAMREIKKAAGAGEDLKKENLIRILDLAVNQEMALFARRLDPGALIDFLDPGILDFRLLDSFYLSRLFFIRGAAKRGTGDYEGASLDFVKAIEQNPDWHYYYEELARLKMERGDLMGALQAIAAGLEASGGSISPEAHYLRGIVLFDIARAAAGLPQKAVLDPSHAAQDQAQAISLAIKAARLLQGRPIGGEGAEAGGAERDPEAYFQSLSLLSAASKADIQIALELAPGHQGAREALEKIEQFRPACRASFTIH